MARVALIGDSHAQALWPIIKPGLTAQGHEVVLSLANPGWSEGKYLTTDLAGQLRSAAPDIVVYELGANNSKKDPNVYGSDLQRLVTMAKDAGASTIIWFAPFHSIESANPPVYRNHEDSRAMQARFLPPLGVKWVDTKSYSQTGHRGDGVHFTSAGYRQLAAQMLPEIRPGGALTVGGVGWVLPVVLGVSVIAIAVALRLRLSR
jgi:hypothetical protein